MPEKTIAEPVSLSFPDEHERGVIGLDVCLDGDIWRTACESFEPALAAVGAALSFSSVSHTALTDNLKALGFANIDISRLYNADPHRIGMATAERDMGDHILTAVILCPTRSAEWYSNFRIGYAREHKGFSIAADRAESMLSGMTAVGERVRSYFVTGYSRGGAVADVLARRLCDRCGVDRVRCYAFAAPNTTLAFSGASYGSIFDLVRDEDFFARVPLSSWGYRHYGRDIALRGDIRDAFRGLTGEEYIGYTGSKDVDGVIAAVRRLAPDVRAYYSRCHPVGDRRLSMFGYMNSVAAMLADDMTAGSADIIVDAMTSEFAELSDFLTAGADIASLMSCAQGIPRCSVADSHSPAAYLAAMRVNFSDLF